MHEMCLQGLPELVDGGETAVQPEQQEIEEEFDLSDIMGEQVGSSLSTEERLKQIEQEEQVMLGLLWIMHCTVYCRASCRGTAIRPSAGIFWD